MIELDYPLHLVLTQKSLNAQVNIIGVAIIDWRKVLHSGRVSTLVELRDQNHPQISVGILDLIMELLPTDQEKASKDELDFHVSYQLTVFHEPNIPNIDKTTSTKEARSRSSILLVRKTMVGGLSAN